MRGDIEDYFLNPPPGSAAARAAEFGIDLTLTLENLRLTPEERIRKLEEFIEGIAKLKASIRFCPESNLALAVRLRRRRSKGRHVHNN